MPELKNYPAVVNGKETILRLSDTDAKTRGLSRTVTVAELSAKSRQPANKAATPANKGGNADAEAAAAAAAKEAAAKEAAAKSAAAKSAADKTAK